MLANEWTIYYADDTTQKVNARYVSADGHGVSVFDDNHQLIATLPARILKAIIRVDCTAAFYNPDLCAR